MSSIVHPNHAIKIRGTSKNICQVHAMRKKKMPAATALISVWRSNFAIFTERTKNTRPTIIHKKPSESSSKKPVMVLYTNAGTTAANTAIVSPAFLPYISLPR